MLSNIPLLSWLELRYLLLSLILIPLTRLSINRWGLQRVHLWLWRHIPQHSAKNPALTEKKLIRLCRVMTKGANLSFIHTTCLHRSLTICWLLQRRGIGCELHIGVTRQNGIFAAHAWVEKDGTVLNDKRDKVLKFVEFDQPLTPKMFDTQ